MGSTSNEDKISWTKEEKFELLEALLESQSLNPKHIKKYLWNKTEHDVEAALRFYSKKAFNYIGIPIIQKKKVYMSKVQNVIPLSSWSKYIIDTHGFTTTEQVAVLRLLAEMEDKPNAVITDKIDFNKIYLILADALEGKSLTNEKHIWPILDKCILETALTSRAVKRGAASMRSIIHSSCNQAETDMSTFTKPTEIPELAAVRCVSAKTKYNPLQIPENYLKIALFTE